MRRATLLSSWNIDAHPISNQDRYPHGTGFIGEVFIVTSIRKFARWIEVLLSILSRSENCRSTSPFSNLCSSGIHIGYEPIVGLLVAVKIQVHATDYSCVLESHIVVFAAACYFTIGA